MKSIFTIPLMISICIGFAWCQNEDMQEIHKNASDWLAISDKNEIVVGKGSAIIKSEAILNAIADLSRSIESHIESYRELTGENTSREQFVSETSVVSDLFIGVLKIDYFSKQFIGTLGDSISINHFEITRNIVFAKTNKSGILSSFKRQNEDSIITEFTMTFRNSDIEEVIRELEDYFFFVNIMEENERYFVKVTINKDHYDSIVGQLEKGGKINRKFLIIQNLYREYQEYKNSSSENR